MQAKKEYKVEVGIAELSIPYLNLFAVVRVNKIYSKTDRDPKGYTVVEPKEPIEHELKSNDCYFLFRKVLITAEEPFCVQVEAKITSGDFEIRKFFVVETEGG